MPDVSQESRRSLLREFERAAKRMLGWGLAGVVYRMVTEPALPLVARRGAVVRDSPGSSIIHLHWPSVDGWLASLSKNRRKSMRRKMRTIAEADDLVVTTAPARSDLDPAELAALNRLHTARLASTLDPRADLPTAYFERLLGREDVSMLTYHDTAGKLLAYLVIFDHADTPISATWAALRPEEGGRQDLYYDVYPRMIQMALDGGKKAMLAGRGRWDIKQTLGFDHIPMKVVAVPRWSLG